MTVNEYQQLAMRTDDKNRDNFSRIRNACYGLCGESGECIDILKKHEFQGHELDKEKLLDEVSDCAWYVALMAEGLGVTLEEVFQHNVDKLKKRYPDGFDPERSIHREKYEV